MHPDGARVEPPALHVTGPDGNAQADFSFRLEKSHSPLRDIVELPNRYAPRRCDDLAELPSITARVEDAEIALSWIRNELKIMKVQDASLAGRFQDLQKTIQLVRSGSSPFSSASSINEGYSSSSSRVDVAYLRDSCEVEFRPRTSSLLVPRRNGGLSVSECFVGGTGLEDFRLRTNSLLSPSSTYRSQKAAEAVVLQSSSADNVRNSSPCATRH